MAANEGRGTSAAGGCVPLRHALVAGAQSQGASSQAMTTSIGGLARSADTGQFGLLADKLEIPAIGLAVIDRPRLSGLMDEATGHRVTLVTGPAGAGKTGAC